jgi:hypothetical protein
MAGAMNPEGGTADPDLAAGGQGRARRAAALPGLKGARFKYAA